MHTGVRHRSPVTYVAARPPGSREAFNMPKSQTALLEFRSKPDVSQRVGLYVHHVLYLGACSVFTGVGENNEW